MNKDATSPQQSSDGLTQHAMLVAWGLYARQLGLVEALEQVALKQKTYKHCPQTKVLEFWSPFWQESFSSRTRI